jgi:hypothetical protein
MVGVRSIVEEDVSGFVRALVLVGPRPIIEEKRVSESRGYLSSKTQYDPGWAWKCGYGDGREVGRSTSGAYVSPSTN